MILDLHDRVKIAYKKLKQMVHYEKHPLRLRQRLAEFECEGDLEDRLAVVAKVAASKTPYKTADFNSWLGSIQFELIPKGVESPPKLSDDQGSFLTNVTSATEHKISKVNYIFDGPVELHLLSVLWLMIEGPAYDHTLSDHCSGSRLHSFVGSSEDHSAYLFKKYHELYAKWRDKGIQKATELLSKDGQNLCVIGLDVREYYYRIQLDWETLRNQIQRVVPSDPLDEFFLKDEIIGGNLFRCIEAVCRNYRQKLSRFLAITHPDLPDNATCLPIGLCASPVIANWYLKEFDDAVLEKVRPAYYGRYVDDILMVVPMSKPPQEADPIGSFMEQVFVRSGILKPGQGGFELCSRPGLFLQKKKCTLQFFDATHSTAGLEKFQKQIDENASDFALLPVDGDDSPVAQVAYDLLYDGSANKFRSVKEVTENRWALASHLAKQTQLHLMSEGPIDQHLKDELFRFFKGRNAIDYWDMWERVISFFVVAGDKDAAELFRKSIWGECLKVTYVGAGGSASSMVSESFEIPLWIRKALAVHLNLCMELSLAIISSTEKNGNVETRIWRESNLIRHHLVAIPLLNYTAYEGNLAAPIDATGLVIDWKKAANTPRFVHFDECLGFVNSGCYRASMKKDGITQANEIYKQFHGSEIKDITSELIVEEKSK